MRRFLDAGAERAAGRAREKRPEWAGAACQRSERHRLERREAEIPSARSRENERDSEGGGGETRRVAEYLTAQRRDDPEEEKEKTIQKPGKGMVRAS